MGILDWMWHSGDEAAAPAGEGRQVSETIERIVHTANPRLRLVKRYRERLAPAVAALLVYAEDCANAFAAPLQASAANWANDPALNAFFATSEELARAFARSRELHAYFDRMPGATETVAVLGMALAERQVMGAGMDGEILHNEVARTTLSFSDHRVRICTDSEATLRKALAARVVEQMALQALACITAGESRRRQLEGERSAFAARLRLLQRHDLGLGPMLGAQGNHATQERRRLEARLARNERELRAVGAGAGTLERQLEQVREILSEPRRYVAVTTRRVRLTRMNVVLSAPTTEPSNEIEFQIVRYGAEGSTTRAVAVVRYARGELAPAPATMNEAVLKELDPGGFVGGSHRG